MGRKRGPGSKQDFLKERPGEATQNTVSLRHVNVPDAELRLEQALEVLLEGTSPLDEIVTGQNLLEAHDDENASDNGDAT